MSQVRTRFAPSPTGLLHVGGLRIAIYNYLFAKQNKGQFILRIEDTDKERQVPGAVESLINTLKDLNLNYDEGPILKNNKIVTKGNNGPYIQSQRLEIYQKYAEQLLNSGHAYYCFCSPERLTGMRENQLKKGQPPKYDRFCRNLSVEEIQKKLHEKIPHVIRLKVPDNKIIKCQDLIRGEVEFNSNDIDDQVLIKSDGYPTYHLAVVVDDYLMKITHIIRGEDWLPSTPKHQLIYEFLGWPVPKFAHVSLLLNSDRTKLSKRKGDVAVEDFLKNGYLKETLINFIAIIGWSESTGSEQEIYDLESLIKKFDLHRLTKAGAIFNLEKLDWLNGYYIRHKKIKELTKLCLPFLKSLKPGINLDLAKKIVAIERERLKKLTDISQNINFLTDEKIDYPAELLIWKKSTKEQTLDNLVKLEDLLLNFKSSDFKNIKKLENKILDWIKKNNYGVGDMLWPLRVALSGQQNSPNPFEIAWILGQKITLTRLNQAQLKLK